LSCNNGSGGQHCLASMDSYLEAFSRNNFYFFIENK
jgi:hypothetical protein